MKIGVATCSALPPQFDDDRRLLDALAARGAEAAHVVWDDPAVAWEQFDRVVIRTTWDHPHKHARMAPMCHDPDAIAADDGLPLVLDRIGARAVREFRRFAP